MPVSYTHLDVYKRQVILRMSHHQNLFTVMIHQKEYSGIIRLRKYGTVSYTHLMLGFAPVARMEQPFSVPKNQ